MINDSSFSQQNDLENRLEEQRLFLYPLEDQGISFPVLLIRCFVEGWELPRFLDKPPLLDVFVFDLQLTLPSWDDGRIVWYSIDVRFCKVYLGRDEAVVKSVQVLRTPKHWGAFDLLVEWFQDRSLSRHAADHLEVFDQCPHFFILFLPLRFL